MTNQPAKKIERINRTFSTELEFMTACDELGLAVVKGDLTLTVRNDHGKLLAYYRKTRTENENAGGWLYVVRVV